MTSVPSEPCQPEGVEELRQSELRLARRAAEGDRAAFEEIYRLHVGRVYGLCLRLTADVPEAEILTQDTFVRAWFAMPGFAGRGALGSWLGRMATNLWKDRYRSRARRRKLMEDLAATGRGPVSPCGEARSTEDGVTRLLTAMDLDRCIARLPEGARAVYVLFEIEGLPHREIAEMLDVAVGTVKGQLHRARRLIRGMLAPDGKRDHEQG